MGIFSRLTEIVNANINALLEKAEDPEKIVKLMIQEMEETLVEVRSAAAKAIAEKKEKSRAMKYLEQEELDWEQKAELALRKERDDLAKSALLEKARVGDRRQQLSEEMKLVESNLDKLNDDLAKLQSKLSDAKARQRTLALRHKAAQTQLKARSKIYDERIDDVLHRFEYAERRIDHVESEGEALALGRANGHALADQIVDLKREEEVNAELAAMKARLSGPKPATIGKENSNG